MKILAGIVLYNPDYNRLKKNIKAIIPQVDRIVVVNNGSTNVNSDIKRFITDKKIYILDNKENLGIAVALNQLLEYAKENGFNWLLTLDQDSIVPLNMISMYKSHLQKDSIGIVCPRICDINAQCEDLKKQDVELIENEEDVITSGSCINTKAAIEIGGFDEKLFIDFVDTEFQKRMLLSGYKILKDNNVSLTHEIGNIKFISVLGFKIICTNHNSFRRYYQVRNRLYYKKKYYGEGSLIKEKVRLILGTFKIILFEDDKKQKVNATIRGLRDYKNLLSMDIVSRIKEKNNMKISFVLPALYGTGGINVVYEYSRRLTERGHDVTIYAPILAYNMHRGIFFVDLLKQIYATMKVTKSIIIDKLPNKMSQEKGVKVKVVFRISNQFIQDADIVIATAWCTTFNIDRLSNKKGEKVYFIQGYEVWDNETLGKQSYLFPFKKIVIAEWIKEKLVEECQCKDENITIINNGIDTKKFKQSFHKKSLTKKITCLMLDHSLEKKGVKFGIEAFVRAKKVVPELELKMFGIKKSKNVPEGIKYYEDPSQEVLVRLYQDADIYIFPSIEEGWGLTPIEAMACKCAVVGTNVGCMMDIGIDNENVVLCEKANSEELAEGIIKLTLDTEYRKKISENGYETVQKLDWDISVTKFENVLQQLLDSH